MTTPWQMAGVVFHIESVSSRVASYDLSRLGDWLSTYSKGSQDHPMLYIVFFRISNIGHHSGCSKLVLTQTAMVVGNFKYLGFVVKIERLQWGRQ